MGYLLERLVSTAARELGVDPVELRLKILVRADQTVIEDGLVSVRRGFRLHEWRELAERAAIPSAHIWRYHGTRIVLQARKIPGRSER